MTRLVLHVGMHKTGSSSVQHALAGLDSADACYLDLGRGPNHSGALQGGFSSRPGDYHVFRRRGMDSVQVQAFRADVRERLDAGLASGRGRLCILSGEDTAKLDEEGLRDLVTFLQARVDAIEVIGYVRPPRSFMESAFQQRVKGGLARLEFAPLYPGYRSRFLKFEALLGRSGLRLFPFMRDRLRDGDVVADFCARIGVASPAGRLQLNQSLTRPAVSLLFTFRRFGAPYGNGQDEIRANKALLSALSDLGGDKIRFAGPQVEEVIARFQNDQRWVERRIGVALDEEAADGDSIRCERDLLHYDESQLSWLREWTEAVPTTAEATPERVATAIDRALPSMVESFRAAKKRARIESAKLDSAGRAVKCA